MRHVRIQHVLRTALSHRRRPLLLPQLAIRNNHSHHRSFSVSPQTVNSKPSSEYDPYEAYIESMVLDMVRNSRSKKWGWVIYRCTYNDEATWQRLKQSIFNQTHERVAITNTPELINHLDMVFFEDRALFEGASREQLRVHFKAWRDDAFSKLGPSDLQVCHGGRRPGFVLRHPDFMMSRFQQFIQVDEESLQSMCEEFENPVFLLGTGHVNFVFANWPHKCEWEEEEEDCDDDKEVFEPIDGCTEKDVGWMKVAATGLDSSFFYFTCSIEGWQDEYVRPPEVHYI